MSNTTGIELGMVIDSSTDEYVGRTMTTELYIQILSQPNAPDAEAKAEMELAQSALAEGKCYVRLKFFPMEREEREFLEEI